MRPFPRAVSGRATAPAVALLALALVCPASPATAVVAAPVAASVHQAEPGTKDLKQRRQQVERRQRGARRSLDASSVALRRADARLAQARSGLSQARSRLATAQAAVATAQVEDRRQAAALASAEAELTRARAALVAGRRAVAAQHATLVDSITGYYEQGDPQLLALTSLMDDRTPADVTRRLSFMDTLVTDQTTQWNSLQAAEVRLAQQQRSFRTARDSVATRRAAAADQLARTEAAQQAAATAASDVQAAVGANAAAYTEASRARRSDLAVLRRLAAQEKRIKAKILAAARRDAAAKRSAYRGETGGVLLRPVAGPITSPYGWRIHPIYGYWGLHDGVDIGAGCGTPLKAVAGGTVLSEYYSSSWGNRLYLNLGSYNGANVTVIYNHLSSYRAHSGQRVAKGETVGYVGTTGWSTGCHLHFSVLVDGSSVDPAGWIG